MTLTQKQREEMRENWLAPARSEEERQFLEILLEHGKLNESERKYVLQWRDGRDGRGMHWNAFLDVATKRDMKQRVMGKPVHETAMRRHADLEPNTWFVAYFTSMGYTQKEMAKMLGFADDDGIRYHMDKLRERIKQEYGCSLKSVNTRRITRWFLGL
jgi:hypothetical protein